MTHIIRACLKGHFSGLSGSASGIPKDFDEILGSSEEGAQFTKHLRMILRSFYDNDRTYDNLRTMLIYKIS